MVSKATPDELHLLAAGSLKEVTAAIGKTYERATGAKIIADFGPSGLLR
jgi:ABC-type molybdate transport system substrate-binding protein